MCFGKNKGVDSTTQPLLRTDTPDTRGSIQALESVLDTGARTGMSKISFEGASFAGLSAGDEDTLARRLSYSDAAAHTKKTGSVASGLPAPAGASAVFRSPVSAAAASPASEVDPNPRSASKDEEDTGSGSEDEELPSVPLRSNHEILEEAIGTGNTATFSEVLQAEPNLINTEGLYARLAASHPDMLLTAFNFLSTTDRFDDGQFYADLQNTLDLSSSLTYGSRKKTSSDMKFNTSNPFHKLAWHNLTTKTNRDMQKATVKYFINLHPEEYDIRLLDAKTVSQLIQCKQVGMIYGMAESEILYNNYSSMTIQCGSTAHTVNLPYIYSLLEYVAHVSKTKEHKETCSQIYKNILKTPYFSSLIESLPTHFPEISDEIERTVSSKTSVGNYLHAKYSGDENYNTILLPCYLLMKRANNFSKIPGFSDDLSDAWLIITDDATTRTYGTAASARHSVVDFDAASVAAEGGGGFGAAMYHHEDAPTGLLGEGGEAVADE